MKTNPPKKLQHRHKITSWRLISVCVLAVIAIGVTIAILYAKQSGGGVYSYSAHGTPAFVDKNAQPLCKSASAAEAARTERDNLPYPKVDNPAYCTQPQACKDRKLLVSYDRDSLIRTREAYVYLATDNGSSIGSVWIYVNLHGGTPINSEVTGFAYTPNSTAKFKITGDVVSTYTHGFFNGQESISKAHVQIDIESECGKFHQKVAISDSFTPSQQDVDAERQQQNSVEPTPAED